MACPEGEESRLKARHRGWKALERNEGDLEGIKGEEESRKKEDWWKWRAEEEG